MLDQSGGVPIAASRVAPRPSVAVVAVHGVGDHEPGASASAIAQLLLRLRYSEGGADENRYTSFRTQQLSIPVKRVPVTRRAEGESEDAPPVGRDGMRGRWRAWADQFRERSTYLRDIEARSPAATPADAVELRRSIDGADHQFMRAQLIDYQSSGDPYDTLRLEGHRLPPDEPSSPNANVHVYEVNWSQLARLQWGPFKIAYQLAQLLFHVPHLGRQAVDFASLEFPDDRRWRRYRSVYTGAVRVFTLLVPLVWLMMGATILTVVPRAGLPIEARPWVAAVVPALVALVYGGIRIFRREAGTSLAIWVLAPLGLMVTAGAATWFAVALGWITAEQVLSLEWIAISSAIVLWSAGAYEAVRPGARTAGRIIVCLAAIPHALAILLARPDTWIFATSHPDRAIVDRTIHVFELETFVVLGLWVLFYVLAGSAAILGMIARRSAPNDASRARAVRAEWTARATLAMSAVGVLFVSFPIWALLYWAFSWALPDYITYTPLTPFFGPPGTYADYVEQIFRGAVGAGLPWLLGITTFLGLFVMWVVVPSLWAEVSPPSLADGFDASPDAPPDPSGNKREATASNDLGRWLTRGAGVIRPLVTVLFIIMVMAAGVSLVGATTTIAALDMSADGAKELVLLTGGWLAGSMVGFAAFSGRLQKLLLGFRPVLDALLDVDTYLREHPRDDTPRARIAERFASLLRYLCKWRDATGLNGYTAIIFVAHSQGTVISADYLGFIRREPDPDLPPLLSAAQHLDEADPAAVAKDDGPALYLFTMGSPLRQLYSAAFPHLFAWVRGDEGSWWKRLPSPSAEHTFWRRRWLGRTQQVDLRDDASPNPVKIGLERWVNAYRSGDYVGRQLWRSPEMPSLYRPYESASDSAYWDRPQIIVSEDAAGSRRELCIGAGAHTHYWDETAKAIAVELDRMIVEAINEAPVIMGLRKGGKREAGATDSA